MTGGGVLRVDTAAVKGHAGNLQEALSSFGQNAAEFDSALGDLLGSGLKDGAESAFRNIHSQWMDASEQVKKGLEEMGVRTEDIASAYDQGKQEQADSAESAGNQMDFHIESV